MGELGKVLNDNYCILERLGEGGAGEVYLARDQHLGKLWGIKVLKREQEQEVQIQKSLSHYMLPRVIDCIYEEEKVYLVMDYIRGETLAFYLKKGKFFSQKKIVQWGIEICQALEYLHQQDPPVIYGDLKPENLMLSSDGKLHLVDFGASMRQKPQKMRITEGTCGYAAPEQYRGQVSAVSDIYSLGKTLEALCHRKQKGRLDKIIRKCTRKNPKARYQSCKEVKEALEHWRKEKSEHTLRLLPFIGIGILTAFTAGMSLLPERVVVRETEKETSDFWGEYTALNQMILSAYEEAGEIRSNMLKQQLPRLEKLLSVKMEQVQRKRLWFLKAQVYETIGDIQRAEETYGMMQALWSEDPEIYSRYGVLILQQDVQKAKELYQRAMEELPQAAHHWNLHVLNNRIRTKEASEKRNIGKRKENTKGLAPMSYKENKELGGFEIQVKPADEEIQWNPSLHIPTIKPEIIKPETIKPETIKPETIKPETSKPTTPKPTTPEPSIPKPTTPEPSIPKSETSKSAAPTPARTESAESELSVPTPEAPTPETEAMKSSTPEPKIQKPPTSKLPIQPPWEMEKEIPDTPALNLPDSVISEPERYEMKGDFLTCGPDERHPVLSLKTSDYIWVLSLRINGKEVDYDVVGSQIILKEMPREEMRQLILILRDEENNPVKLHPWIF